MISEYEFLSIRPGDRVRIVSQWNDRSEENSRGEMDAWLGTMMTVVSRGTLTKGLYMAEDGEKWIWNRWCIEYVEDNLPENPDISILF